MEAVFAAFFRLVVRGSLIQELEMWGVIAPFTPFSIVSALALQMKNERPSGRLFACKQAISQCRPWGQEDVVR